MCLQNSTKLSLIGVVKQTSADRIALPLLQAPPDLSLVTIVTEAGCPTMHCSSPAPIASLWLATALMKTRVEREGASNGVKCKNAFSSTGLNIFCLSHLVVTMVPRLCMDFLSPSVSITRSSWSFSSG